MVNIKINLEFIFVINLRNVRLFGFWFLGVVYEGFFVVSDYCEGVGGVDIDIDRGLVILVIGVSYEFVVWFGCWVVWVFVI